MVADKGEQRTFEYTYSRLTFKRAVIEKMQPGDELTIRIRPRDGSEFVVRMTREDIEREFANVIESRSYRAGGSYNCSTFPMQAEKFIVEGCAPTTTKRLRPTRARWPRLAIPELAAAIGPVEWARAVATHAGREPESHACLQAVEHWRTLWRPESIRILLVAESHVAERPGDADVSVQHDAWSGNYCRLIYCLGYGENAICSHGPIENRGTSQYWEIFRRAAGVEESAPRGPSRLGWKVRILERMRENGIWLVDASIVAIAAPGGIRRFEGALGNWVVRESWDRFVWPSVQDERAEQVWVIGKGVGRALEGHAAIRPDRVIDQPQSHHVERYRAGLDRMMREIHGC